MGSAETQNIEKQNTWSYEPVQATIDQGGALVDVQIPARHPLVSGGNRPVRGAVFRTEAAGSAHLGSASLADLGGDVGREVDGDIAKETGGARRSPRRRQGPRRRPDHRGRVTVIRRAATPRTEPAPLDVDVQIPPVPKDPVPIPWSTMIPSVIGGAVIALLFSPMFAILAGVTAVGLLGRSLASTYTFKRKTKTRAQAMIEAEAQIEAGRGAWAHAEAARRVARDRLTMDLLGSGLAEGMMPWSRRLEPGAELEVCVGVGRQETAPDLAKELQDRLGDAPALATQASAGLVLPTAPVVRTLRADSGMAISGDRVPALQLARHVLTALQIELGPADLAMVLLTTQDRLRDWDWLKWLPSFLGAALGPEEIESLLEPFAQADQRTLGSRSESSHPVLVIVDGVEPSGPGAFAKAFAGRLPDVRLVCVAEAFEAPAACGAHIEVRPDGSFAAHNLIDPSEPAQCGQARALTIDQTREIVRLLAPLDDPELDDAGASLPSRVSHEALYAGIASAVVSSESGQQNAWSEVLAERWSKADRHHLTSTLGLDRNGPVSLDLVVDGPHMLAAGTTGSGKSEMLRSLIVGAAIDQPPDQVSFLLVDFKGGGAFDLVAGLPHVAAVVTDLDPSESGRALRSLQAEMRTREEVLRDNECSDIADLVGDVSLARLVIVVDEFASLAEELPEFLDGLVDVARRGRSLGVHLVLATQRPAGVVTGQIRANTNLRVCLRVQDQSDSMDVLDSPEAARLPPIPGRAIISRGGSKNVTIQCVKVEADDANKLVPFVVHPALVASATHLGLAGPASQSEAAEDPMRDLVAACAALVPERNSAPWLDPISSVDLHDVQSALCSSEQNASVALGWLDDPDQRRRVPFGWSPTRGGLAVIGSDSDVVEASVRTAIAGLVASGATHVYVLDGSGGALKELESLPSVGSVIGIGEPERGAKLLSHVARFVAADVSERAVATVGLVIHRWGAVVDSLESVTGAMAGAELQKLLRDGADRGLAYVVTAASDREIPSRVMSGIGQRLIHRLADPAGYMSFGLHGQSEATNLDGAAFVDPTTALVGLIGHIASADIVDGGSRNPAFVPASAVKILGDHVPRSDMPLPIVSKRDLLAPLGLDSDLATVSVSIRSGQPTIVVGRSGSGRTTAIETLVGRLSVEDAARVEILDDAERIDPADAKARLQAAQDADRAIIIGATPSITRGIGSWLAPLMNEATVVLINPSKADSDACRILAPDLASAAPGRAVVSDGSRLTVVQIAA